MLVMVPRIHIIDKSLAYIETEIETNTKFHPVNYRSRSVVDKLKYLFCFKF